MRDDHDNPRREAMSKERREARRAAFVTYDVQREVAPLQSGSHVAYPARDAHFQVMPMQERKLGKVTWKGSGRVILECYVCCMEETPVGWQPRIYGGHNLTCQAPTTEPCLPFSCVNNLGFLLQ